MNRGGIIAIAFCTLIILFFVLLVYVFNDSLDHIWYENHLEAYREEPYGFMVMEELLQANEHGYYAAKDVSLTDTLNTFSDSTNYVYIGYSYFADSAECSALIDFVSKGNDAMIIWSGFLPYSMGHELGIHYDYITYDWIDSMKGVELHIPRTNHRSTAHYYHADTITEGYWTSFNAWSFEDSLVSLDYVEGLGTVDSLYNFAVIPVGKGRIFTHLEPRLFSNYYLQTEAGYNYVQSVMGHMKNRPVYFDQYNREYHYQYDLDLSDQKSPLDYLFGSKPLTYAWITLLISVVLFLIFRSKRTQRVIPILPEVENTSIEFAKALGTLYYQSNRTRFLANEMMRLFHTFNRRRYNIQPAEKGVSNAELICQKSKADRALVDKIYELERKLKYNELARMNELIPLFQALKTYYKSAR